MKNKEEQAQVNERLLYALDDPACSRAGEPVSYEGNGEKGGPISRDESKFLGCVK